MRKTARISEDGRYRYELSREWDDALRTLCWVMLNPSTADASTDDPTIRRCIGLSKRWGFGGILVVNLFALRATSPAELKKVEDPIGPENDEIAGFWIRHLETVAAWGSHPLAKERLPWFTEQVKKAAHLPKCIGINKDGAPKHPLYVLQREAKLRAWEVFSEEPKAEEPNCRTKRQDRAGRWEPWEHGRPGTVRWCEECQFWVVDPKSTRAAGDLLHEHDVSGAPTWCPLIEDPPFRTVFVRGRRVKVPPGEVGD